MCALQEGSASAADEDLPALWTRSSSKGSQKPVGRLLSLDFKHGKRLGLEYTFNQKNENQLAGLLRLFDNAVRGPASRGRPPQLDEIIRVAKDVNQIRFDQGDDSDRMSQAFRRALLGMDDTYTDAAWGRRSSSRYTPTSITQIASAAAHQSDKGVTLCLSLVGKGVQLSELVDSLLSYKGPPRCLMSLDCQIPSCQALRTYLLQLRAVKEQYALQLRSASSEREVASMGSWLAALHVEYCCLMNIVVTTNARLIGEWPEDWQPSQYHSALHARDMMVSLGLTQEQVGKLQRLRAENQVHLLDAKVAMSCSLDMAADLATATTHCSGPPPLSETIQLLDTIEAAQAAKVCAAATEYVVTECLLCKILSPHQSHQLLQCVAEVTDDRPCWAASPLAYRVRYHAALILDEDFGRWLEAEEEQEDAGGPEALCDCTATGALS